MSSVAGLLVAPFEAAIWAMFERIVKAGVEQFGQAVRTRRWYAVPGSASAVPSSGAAAAVATTVTSPDDPLAPPAVLMDHTVLGHLCNAFLAAFNELRFVIKRRGGEGKGV